MKRMNLVLLLMAVVVISCLAGCMVTPYTTGYDSSWQGGVSEPQEMVGIPGSSVYFVPGFQSDVFFYNGYWWSPRGNRWYRARDYNGPWGYVSQRYVPAPVYRVPKDYRVRYQKQQRMPYQQWQNQGKGRKQNNRQDNRQDNNQNDRGRRN